MLWEVARNLEVDIFCKIFTSFLMNKLVNDLI